MESEGLLEPADLGLLASEESNVMPNIIDVCKTPAGLDSLSKEVAATTAWHASRAGVDKTAGVAAGRYVRHR